MGGSQSKANEGSRAAAAATGAAATPSQSLPPTDEPTSSLPRPTTGNDGSSGTDGAGLSGGGGGCPMKKGGGGMSWGSMFGTTRNPHLPSKDGTPGLPTTPPPADSGPAATAQLQQPEPSGCPVKGGGGGRGKGKGTTQYNVYSQPIDPTNQMPSVANQLPAPGQRQELDTERVVSTIPKGGADDGTTWTYPSPQMFYNSLARKDKLGDTSEEDIAPVVALHNNMNEKTWAKVLEWEAVLDGGDDGNNNDGGGGPKLLRFMGRPSDLSPKAWFKNWFLGHPLPFDRHDWTVVRPNGTEVRYVIDYYHDESRAKDTEGSGMPDLHDRDAVGSILVDVRPALDGPAEAFGRAVVMPYARRVTRSTEFEPLPLVPTGEMREQLGESLKVWENIQENVRRSKERGQQPCAGEAATSSSPKTIVVPRDDDDSGAGGSDGGGSKISPEEATALARAFASILKECQEAQEAVERCTDDAECARASLALTMCMAKIVCPLQHGAVTKSLNGEGTGPTDAKASAEYDARLDAALENVALCVAGASERAAVAKVAHPDLFAKEDARR